MIIDIEEYEEVKHIQEIDRAVLIISAIILAVLGIPGNFVAALVIRHRKMRDSDLTIYLVSLCLFNILSLGVYTVRNLATGILGNDVKDYSFYLCGIWILLSHLTVSIVAWHHVAIAANRALHFSLELKDLKKKWEPHYIVTLICLFCGIYNIFITNFGVSHTFREKHPSSTEGGRKVEIFVSCDLGPSSNWSYLLLLVNSLVPCAAVAVLNSYLDYIKRHPTELVNKRNGNSPTSLRRELMKIVVIYNVLFIVSSLPYHIVNASTIKFFPKDTTVMESKTYIALHLTHTLLMTHQAGLLYLSCVCSHRFREELLQLILPVLTKFFPTLEKYRRVSTAADSEGSFFNASETGMAPEVATMFQQSYQPAPPSQHSANGSGRQSLQSGGSKKSNARSSSDV